MGLVQRLADARAMGPAEVGAVDGVESPAHDPLGQLRERTQEALLGRLGSRLYDTSLSQEQLLEAVQRELAELVRTEETPLSGAERRRLAQEVSESIIGYGPIQPYLDDPTVTEVMVMGATHVYVERAGRIHRAPARFLSDDHLRRVIERIVSQVGRRIDESSPLVDARLADGSRVNAVIPPISVKGPALTIRKFSKDPYQVDDLVDFGTFDPTIAAFLAACVEGKLNVLISGGTGSGKTTLLNVLSSFIPGDERIVTIEDAMELQLHQEHVVTMETRPSNIEGRGEVTIRDLVRNSLRMRPDRIVVGEVRGGETLDMLQAMNTGHEGSLSTVHANSPRDAMSRLETMVLMAGMELPLRAIREQVASALDVIVHLSRLSDGTRRVTHVTEVTGMEGDVITLQDIFTYEVRASASGANGNGRDGGGHRATGIRPTVARKLAERGVELPDEAFGDLRGIVDQHLNGSRKRGTR